MIGRLRRMIEAQPAAGEKAMAQWHPVAPQPHVLPLSVVTVSSDMVIVEEAAPLWGPRGAPISATSPGAWDQVHAAGRA